MIIQHFESIIKKWKDSNLSLSRVLKDYSFKVVKYDFKYLVIHSKSLQEVWEQQKKCKEDIIKDAQVFSDYDKKACKKVCEIADKIVREPVVYDSSRFLIVQGQDRQQLVDKRDNMEYRESLKRIVVAVFKDKLVYHVQMDKPSKEVYDALLDILYPRLDKDKFFAYLDYHVMIHQIEKVKVIADGFDRKSAFQLDKNKKIYAKGKDVLFGYRGNKIVMEFVKDYNYARAIRNKMGYDFPMDFYDRIYRGEFMVKKKIYAKEVLKVIMAVVDNPRVIKDDEMFLVSLGFSLRELDYELMLSKYGGLEYLRSAIKIKEWIEIDNGMEDRQEGYLFTELSTLMSSIKCVYFSSPFIKEFGLNRCFDCDTREFWSDNPWIRSNEKSIKRLNLVLHTDMHGKMVVTVSTSTHVFQVQEFVVRGNTIIDLVIVFQGFFSLESEGVVKLNIAVDSDVGVFFFNLLAVKESCVFDNDVIVGKGEISDNNVLNENMLEIGTNLIQYHENNISQNYDSRNKDIGTSIYSRSDIQYVSEDGREYFDVLRKEVQEERKREREEENDEL